MISRARAAEFDNKLPHVDLAMIYLVEFARYVKENSLYPTPGLLEIGYFIDTVLGREDHTGPRTSTSSVAAVLDRMSDHGIHIEADRGGQSSRMKHMVHIPPWLLRD